MSRFLFTICFAGASVLFLAGTVQASPVLSVDEKAEEDHGDESLSADGHSGESQDGHDHSSDGGSHEGDAHGGEHHEAVTYDEFLENLGLDRADMSKSEQDFAKEQHKAANHSTDLPMNFQRDLALWSLITFLIFLFVMKKVAWQPMIEGLDQREAGIRKAISEADENQRKSAAMLAEYEEKLRGAEQTVADMVAEAKSDAERTSADIVAKAEADVEALRDRAKGDIAQAKDTALAEVFTSVNAQVAAATENVLGRALNDDDQDRLIQEALAEIGS